MIVYERQKRKGGKGSSAKKTRIKKEKEKK